VDEFLWERPRAVAFFAAGNAGPTGRTITDPSLSKSAVAVGATLTTLDSVTELGQWLYPVAVLTAYTGGVGPAPAPLHAGVSACWGAGPVRAPFELAKGIVSGAARLFVASGGAVCTGGIGMAGAAGCVVLAQRTGGCTDATRSAVAAAAGAAALVLHWDDPVPVPYTGSSAAAATVPVLGITDGDAAELLTLASSNGGAAAVALHFTAGAGLDASALATYTSAPGGPRTASGFSSRGPTRDGRAKPELATVGYTQSAHAQPGAAPYAQGLAAVSYKAGTSMATPLAAGAAALARQWAAAVLGVADPSGALVKAILVHAGDGATDAPSAALGWGALELANVVGAAWQVAWADDAHALATGAAGTGEARYTVTVGGAPGGTALRATLVYYDYPGAVAGASSALVNDLDLRLVGPGGTPTVRGNGGSSADARNPTERATVAVPGAGTTWRVYVRNGGGVLQGGLEGYQPYALLITAPAGSTVSGPVSVGTVAGALVAVPGGNAAPRGDAAPLPIDLQPSGAARAAAALWPALLAGAAAVAAVL